MDNTHTPCKVLGPRLDNRGHVDRDHTEHGLGLHKAEQGERIRGNVGGSVRMAKTGGDGRCGQAQSGDDRGRPADTLLIHSLAIGEGGFDTGDCFARLRGVDVNADGGVQIRNRVCDAYPSQLGSGGQGHGGVYADRLTGNGIHDILRDLNLSLGNVDRTRVHRTETREVHFTRVQFLPQGSVTIGIQDEFRHDLSRNGGDTVETEFEGPVLRGEEDTEIGGSEVTAILAQIQGVGFDHLHRRHQRCRLEGNQQAEKERY